VSAQYLVRFDDLCPTANWRVWRQVESIVARHGVKPLVAVVPDNQDPELVAAEADPTFWHRVRQWQSRGWAIGLHGYQHRYVTREAGLIGRNCYSEFAGLSETEQRRKITAGLAILSSHDVRADAWVAPAHSFDAITERVLAEQGIDCISDGYSLRPHLSAEGQLWIPQQIARFRRLPAGVWTVCFHVNRWTTGDLERFDADLKRFVPAITTLAGVRAQYGTRRPSLSDLSMERLIRSARSLRGLLAPKEGTACTLPS
jgi:predicted deacetylase